MLCRKAACRIHTQTYIYKVVERKNDVGGTHEGDMEKKEVGMIYRRRAGRHACETRDGRSASAPAGHSRQAWPELDGVWEGLIRFEKHMYMY